ncbi:hypothetical protein K438DRAFT_1854463 [Mycena galopus ATCC 62051]|nr:hypothetical protein K438DRAFT_1854463 [Mycena galopus ATCC 62051]
MIIEQIILAAAFDLSLINSAISSSLPSLPCELTEPTNVTTSNFTRKLGSLLPRTFVLPDTNTIGTFVAFGLFGALLLGVGFAMLYMEIRRKRQHNVYMNLEPRGSPPPALRVDTDFPAEMKAAYLDTTRPRRSSIVAEPLGPLAANQLLSPLAASQQPGFVARPVPVNVPVSAAVSRAPSMYSVRESRAANGQFSHHAYSRTTSATSGVQSEELVQLLDDLSRHPVFTSPMQPGHRLNRSGSLTARPRVFRAHSDGV